MKPTYYSRPETIVHVNYESKDFDHGNATNSVVVIVSERSMSGARRAQWTGVQAPISGARTDDLTQPWNTDPQIIHRNGITFTDEGSQTGALGRERFTGLCNLP